MIYKSGDAIFLVFSAFLVIFTREQLINPIVLLLSKMTMAHCKVHFHMISSKSIDKTRKTYYNCRGLSANEMVFLHHQPWG